MSVRLKIQSLADTVGKAGKIFLVGGSDSFDISGCAAFLRGLTANAQTATWMVRSTEPDSNEIQALASHMKASQPDICIAAGGGTVLDSAKAASFLASQQHTLSEFLENATIEGRPRQTKLIAIPTTAGTGSEATHFAVIYIKSKKWSLARPELLPEFYYLDPCFMSSLPTRQVASTALDALCQATESMWCRAANAESRKYAMQSLRLSIRHTRQAVFLPTRRARDAMLLAAHYAGKAINITKTTAPHALSYGISQQTKLPHGFSVCLTFPELMELTLPRILDEGRDADVLSIRNWLRLFDGQTIEGAVSFYRALRRDLMPLMNVSPINEYERERMTETIVDGVNLERLSNHPIRLSRQDLAWSVSNALKSISKDRES